MNIPLFICIYLGWTISRLYKYYNSNLFFNGCIAFNSRNTKALKKKINSGISEIFSPAFQESNLLFNAFALKAVSRDNPFARFNFKKKDFVKDHKIYKVNVNVKKFKSGLMLVHKVGNTFLAGLMMKKLAFKVNSFSKIQKFSFLLDGCLRNPEVSLPSFKSKYSSYYDLGFVLNSEVAFFIEFILKNCQIPLSLQEYKHFSYSTIRRNMFVYQA